MICNIFQKYLYSYSKGKSLILLVVGVYVQPATSCGQFQLATLKLRVVVLMRKEAHFGWRREHKAPRFSIFETEDR